MIGRRDGQFKMRARTTSESRQAIRSARSSASRTARSHRNTPSQRPMRPRASNTRVEPNVHVSLSVRSDEAPKPGLPFSVVQSEPHRVAPEGQEIAVGTPRLAWRRQMIGIANIRLPRQSALEFRGGGRGGQCQPVGQQLHGHPVGRIADQADRAPSAPPPTERSQFQGFLHAER